MLRPRPPLIPRGDEVFLDHVQRGERRDCLTITVGQAIKPVVDRQTIATSIALEAQGLTAGYPSDPVFKHLIVNQGILLSATRRESMRNDMVLRYAGAAQ